MHLLSIYIRLKKHECSLALFSFVAMPFVGFVFYPSYVSAEMNITERLSFEATSSLKYGYDSSVGVESVDSYSSVSDTSTLFDVSPTVKFKATKDWSMTMLYSRSGNYYQSLTQYDTDISRYSFGTKYKTSYGDFGYQTNNVAADLDGNSFLSLNMHTLDWGKLFNSMYYLRVAYNLNEKTFEVVRFESEESAAEEEGAGGPLDNLNGGSSDSENSNVDNNPEEFVTNGRNADEQSVSVQLFTFFSNKKTSLLVSLNHASEKAESEQYSNSEIQYSIAITQKIDIFSRPSKLKLNIKLAEVDFKQGVDPAIKARADRVLSYGLELKTEINKYFSFLFQLEKRNQDSSDSLVEVDKITARSGVQFTF